MKFTQEQLEVIIESLQQKYDSIEKSINDLYEEQEEVSQKLYDAKDKLDDLLVDEFNLTEGTYYRVENVQQYSHDDLISIVKIIEVESKYVTYAEYTKRIDDGDITFRGEQTRAFKTTVVKWLKRAEYKRISEEEARKEIMDLLKL